MADTQADKKERKLPAPSVSAETKPYWDAAAKGKLLVKKCAACGQFHHYPRQDVVAAEMHRVLRPGGRLYIIDGDRDRLWGRLVYDVVVVMMEGAVKHLSRAAFRSTRTTSCWA